MPGMQMMFTSSKTTSSVQKRKQETQKTIRQHQIKRSFMGLSDLKKTKGCKIEF